jgi:hypothetical protein
LESRETFVTNRAFTCPDVDRRRLNVRTNVRSGLIAAADGAALGIAVVAASMLILWWMLSF